MEPAYKLIFLLLAIVSCLHKIKADFRIVGGVSLRDNDYIPYQISMQSINKNGDIEHFCGGSIISPRTILTAAHCVHNKNPLDLFIAAGLQDLNDTKAQRSQVVSYETHEDYQEFVSNDIAVAYVDPPFKLDGVKVDKIDVSGTRIIGAGEKLMLSGWGAISTDGETYPMRLQILSYKTISNEECKQSMESLTDSEMCAVVRAKGSCGGDSGGPLVLKDGKTFHQVGIVSYGTLICASEYPDVYTRVSSFVDWIKERIE